MSNSRRRNNMLNAIANELQDDASFSSASDDERIEMTMSQLRKISEHAARISMALKQGYELEPWVEESIMRAETHLQNAHDYMVYSKPYDEDEDDDSSEDMTEALQRGKPPKNDPRKTPAEPSERKRGSKKNKPGSAKEPNPSIKFDEKTVNQLKEMASKHNAGGKGSKASLSALKTVYRRGAGAFSSSHHPKMNRHGWAIARVKAFLYLLKNGKPSNPNYKQDNDLLPSGHPLKSSKSSKDKKD